MKLNEELYKEKIGELMPKFLDLQDANISMLIAKVQEITTDALEKAVVDVLLQVLKENPDSHSLAIIQKVALALELSPENYQDFDQKRLALMRKP